MNLDDKKETDLVVMNDLKVIQSFNNYIVLNTVGGECYVFQYKYGIFQKVMDQVDIFMV